VLGEAFHADAGIETIRKRIVGGRAGRLKPSATLFEEARRSNSFDANCPLSTRLERDRFKWKRAASI